MAATGTAAAPADGSLRSAATKRPARGGDSSVPQSVS